MPGNVIMQTAHGEAEVMRRSRRNKANYWSAVIMAWGHDLRKASNLGFR